jgi:GNAT superfamily N-acetyltransferase
MYQKRALDYIYKGREEFFSSKCHTFPKAEYQVTTTHTLCISGIDSPFGNTVWQLPHSFVNEDEVSEILNIFKHKELPYLWWEPPIPIEIEKEGCEKDFAIKDVLVKQGLQVGGLLKGVCTRLDVVSSEINIPKVTIHPVQSLSELRLFCQLVFAIHGMEPTVIEQMYHLSEKSAQIKEEINYLAYQDGQPIGGITLATGERAAGLWNFGTLASHRNQGVGSALIQAALNEAKRQGYQDLMAILMPTQMGRLWRQFHFQEICHFPFYIGNGKL